MKEDELDKLFDSIEDSFDIYEPSENHEAKFLKKLEQQSDVKVVPIAPKKRNWVSIVSIAASIAILMGIFIPKMMTTEEETADLATISPKMEETQDFFTKAIAYQLEEIEQLSSENTEDLVKDAMSQLRKLEKNYDKLKIDLVQSGYNKKVISAMIKNFQKRSSLLEQVLEKIEEINELKLQENETDIL